MALLPNEPSLTHGRTKWTREVAKELFDEMLQWFKDNPTAFMLKQFTTYKEIDSNILGDLYNKYPELISTATVIKDICEVRMIEKGLNSKTNQALAIFCLKNNHGYVDETKVVMSNTNSLKIKIPGVIHQIEGTDITDQKRLE